ncbi:hypothetical protein H4R19_002284 [Coemansia spiralis]|nr:hypothetical protein H4R19_002284 [Coemansia spiralis]
MRINALPDDILRLVLLATLPAIKRKTARVKDGLRLLSVCKRWREIALPMVYDTVFIKCETQGGDGSECADTETMLDLVLNVKCLHVVRRVVVAAHYRRDQLSGLKAVIARMREAADEWKGVRKLELSVKAAGLNAAERGPPASDHEDDIVSISNALAALMPGLLELKLGYYRQTQVTCALFGRLVGLYADQLQVLHSKHALVVPQDRVLSRLRKVKMGSFRSDIVKFQLPRLDPEVIESLSLGIFTDNDMWSMFCADGDGHEISFPRLTNLYLTYGQGSTGAAEHPWALRFPAVKHVRIACPNEECPSMENAVFPARLERLELATGLTLQHAIADAKVQVSRDLTLHTRYASDEDSTGIDIINRILAAADNCWERGLSVNSTTSIPPEFVTCTQLTHLYLCGPTGVDDLMEHVRRQPLLKVLSVNDLMMDDIQTDFTIPACAEHEPVTPLDTQIRKLVIMGDQEDELQEQVTQIVKYLLLKIPTLTSLFSLPVIPKQIRDFVDEYAQWYPHLANIKLELYDNIDHIDFGE